MHAKEIHSNHNLRYVGSIFPFDVQPGFHVPLSRCTMNKVPVPTNVQSSVIAKNMLFLFYLFKMFMWRAKYSDWWYLTWGYIPEHGRSSNVLRHAFWGPYHYRFYIFLDCESSENNADQYLKREWLCYCTCNIVIVQHFTKFSKIIYNITLYIEMATKKYKDAYI